MGTVLGKPLSPGGGGAKIGVTLNEDDTQNLFITDNNTVLNLLVGTEDATATSSDVVSGKTFYAQGQKKTGTGINPVLLWTNENPTSDYSGGEISVDIYPAYIVEVKPSPSITDSQQNGKTLIPNGADNFRVCSGRRIINDLKDPSVCTRIISIQNGVVTFGEVGAAWGNSSYSINGSTQYAIPLNIWGVKITL